MAAVPSIGRARGVSAPAAPEADATRALYERYANQIYGYCLHQLGSREEAEDAVQSTFLNAFRGFRRGVVPEIEQAWLFKIAHNVCLSRRRSSWRRGRIESPADFQFIEETASSPGRRADELIGLQDVLEAMPENQRRAILLREWQGLSYREVAEELGVSQAAVETLIFRARRALADGLETAPAEQRSRRSRLRRPSLGLGNIAAALKSLLASGVGAKVVGAAAVVAITSAGVVGAADLAPGHGLSQHRPSQLPVPSSAPGRSAEATAIATGALPVPWNDVRPTRGQASSHDGAKLGTKVASERRPGSVDAGTSGHAAAVQETTRPAGVPPARSAPAAMPASGASNSSHGAGSVRSAQQATGQGQSSAHGKTTAPGQANKNTSQGQRGATQHGSGTGSAKGNGQANGNANGQANGNANGQANGNANPGAASNAAAGVPPVTSGQPATTSTPDPAAPSQPSGQPSGAPSSAGAAPQTASPSSGQAGGQANGQANGQGSGKNG